jgi:hypothetical protein
MSCCLSNRDNTDFFWCFGMDNGNGYAFEKPQCHEALFAVAESIILVCNCKSVEDIRCVTKIERMNLEIRSSFAFIPLEEQRRSVYTEY